MYGGSRTYTDTSRSVRSGGFAHGVGSPVGGRGWAAVPLLAAGEVDGGSGVTAGAD